MGKEVELDFAAALDTGAEALADSIVSTRPHPLAQLISDPVVSAAMKADGVGPETLAQILSDAAARLGLGRPRRATVVRGRAALV